ncbi:MAG: hypothetical protein R3234_06590, partial [Thermoanaerobaculia bacterium]|nr:hypothetical protein [Thermoanaerobaculia bacterium]
MVDEETGDRPKPSVRSRCAHGSPPLEPASRILPLSSGLPIVVDDLEVDVHDSGLGLFGILPPRGRHSADLDPPSEVPLDPL